ncbi:hypothetical protein ACIBF1_18875 [Spirillospora sp. NPDC050679]
MLSPRKSVTLVLIATAVATTAGLSTALVLDKDQGPFQPGAATAALRCMRHQPYTPEDSYTSDSARNLVLLRYYTANGNRPYCDGKPANTTDAQWARLYLKLGGNPASVRAVLAPDASPPAP